MVTVAGVKRFALFSPTVTVWSAAAAGPVNPGTTNAPATPRAANARRRRRAGRTRPVSHQGAALAGRLPKAYKPGMAATPRAFRMLVDGELAGAASGATFDSVNPSTGDVACVVPDAGVEDVERAVRAARRAFDESDWATQGRASRIRTVRAFVEGITARLP